MKAALPPRWHFPAATLAAAGVAVLLLLAWLIAWTAVAVGGFEQGVGSVRVTSFETGAAPVAPFHATLKPLRRHGIHMPTRTHTADERLATSDNLLDFVESIRQQPVQGGHYLALKAYDFCTREARLTLDAMQDAGDASQAVIADGRQLAAQARLAQLCGTFRNHQLLALDYYLIAEEGLQARDPRLLMAQRMEKLSAQWDTTSHDDAGLRQALIADVLHSGDGAMIRDLASELEVILHTGRMVVGGQRVPESESTDVVDALRLMACELGATCARENEWQQVLACASAGECGTPPSIHHVNALRWREQIRQAQWRGAGALDIVPAEQRY